MHLVNGTGNGPSPGRPTPGVVKQDKSSGASVDTIKTRSDPQRVRMSSGERPIGAAKGKQSDTEALCQPPHPRPRPLHPPLQASPPPPPIPRPRMPHGLQHSPPQPGAWPPVRNVGTQRVGDLRGVSEGVGEGGRAAPPAAAQARMPRFQVRGRAAEEASLPPPQAVYLQLQEAPGTLGHQHAAGRQAREARPQQHGASASAPAPAPAPTRTPTPTPTPTALERKSEGAPQRRVGQRLGTLRAPPHPSTPGGLREGPRGAAEAARLPADDALRRQNLMWAAQLRPVRLLQCAGAPAPHPRPETQPASPTTPPPQSPAPWPSLVIESYHGCHKSRVVAV